MDKAALSAAIKADSMNSFAHFDPADIMGADTAAAVAVDDNIIIQGQICAAGSRMLADFRPPYQAESVDRLLKQGYALAGHANIDEFGIGGSTESSYFGPTRNPLAPGHICSGAAAAAAQGIVGAALIADAGGAAIRQAAFAGCAGYRPSYGMVSRYGLIAYVNSCEQIGGLARDIDSAAALVQAVAGHDAKDATSLPQQGYDLSGGHDPAGLRIALLEPEPEPAPEIGDMLAQAAHKLARAGARVDKVRLPEADYAAAAFMIIAAAEGCTNISRFDGVKYGYRAADYRSIEELYRRSRSQAFGAEAKLTALLGSYVLSKGGYQQYYYSALQARYLLDQAFRRLFAGYDAALLPAAGGAAYALGENAGLKLHRRDLRYTAPAALCGLPAVALPAAAPAGGGALPLGLQIIAARGQDRQALTVARAWEKLR